MSSTWTLPLFPGYSLTLGLFSKADNVGVERGEECILVDATIVPDVFLIQSAACRALSSFQHSSLVTKGLLEEVVFYLYPSNNTNRIKEFCTVSSFGFYISLSSGNESPGSSLPASLSFLPLEKHADVLDRNRIAVVYNLKDEEYDHRKHFTQCLNSIVAKRI